jgi:molybdopterin converting factor small subunit
MVVTVQIPSALRKYCAGAATLPVSAATVRAALEELARNHPSLYRNLCDETGTLRRHLNVFVNSSHVRDREGLDSALAPGDVVTILTAVSGG